MKSLNIVSVNSDTIKFTPQNARKIEDDALSNLRYSIEHLGLIRPLILSNENVLISGNQRTKTIHAMGLRQAPCVIMDRISNSEMMTFILLVNSLENNDSHVMIEGVNNIPINQYHEVEWDKISVIEQGNVITRRDIARSIVKHGQWGNAIINEDGKVIFNSDYASVCKLIGYPLTVYKVDKEQEEFISQYFYLEYGQYHYDHLNLPSYSQTYVQPQRRIHGANGMRSLLYEEVITDAYFKAHKSDSMLDFGAGKKVYADYYREQGNNIFAYEPFFKRVDDDSTYFDLKQIVKDIHDIRTEISENGLFGTVICDSVLNATTSKKLEEYVITTCASLVREGGTLFICSRSLKRMLHKSNKGSSKIAVDDSKRVYEMDENNMYMYFRHGHFISQKGHTVEGMKEHLERYFENVQQRFVNEKSPSSLYFECTGKKPIPLDEICEALDEEFNLEYPNNYRHNQHLGLVEEVINKNKNK